MWQKQKENSTHTYLLFKMNLTHNIHILTTAGHSRKKREKLTYMKGINTQMSQHWGSVHWNESFEYFCIRTFTTVIISLFVLNFHFLVLALFLDTSRNPVQSGLLKLLLLKAFLCCLKIIPVHFEERGTQQHWLMSSQGVPWNKPKDILILHNWCVWHRKGGSWRPYYCKMLRCRPHWRSKRIWLPSGGTLPFLWMGQVQIKYLRHGVLFAVYFTVSYIKDIPN